MKPGLDRIAENPALLANLGRIGIVTNQAVTTLDFRPAVEVIYAASLQASGSEVTAVFGPQHGYGQTEQDNMIETPDGVFVFQDGSSVPLYSLYSHTRIPLPEQVANVDTFVLDLQDIGCRVYTYMQTLAACLEVAAQHGKKVVVLDRPNPLGLSWRDNNNEPWQRVEGNVLDLKFESFVGWYPIPMRHGLSMAELGRFYIAFKRMNVEYDWIAVEGLRRKSALTEIAALPWTLPSPNMPSWQSSVFFPSFVVLEGTNISEGRGTTLPFQIIGAPYLDVQECMNFVASQSRSMLGIGANEALPFAMRPHDFRPTFNKHAGKICKGLQVHVLRPEAINTFELGMLFLHFAVAFHKDEFRWKDPGYEYNFTDMPYLLILGDDRWRACFEKAQSEGLSQNSIAALHETLHWARKDAQTFAERSQESHIYS